MLYVFIIEGSIVSVPRGDQVRSITFKEPINEPKEIEVFKVELGRFHIEVEK